VIVRTSIGPMARPLLALNTAGDLLTGASGKGFAGPVVWCCTPDGEERVVYSDGRADALRPGAVAFDGEIARTVLAGGGAASIIERLETGVVQREDFAPLNPIYALGPQTVAEDNRGFLLRPRISTREGPIARAMPGFSGPPPPGAVRRLWMDGERAVALAQRGRRWEIYRYENDGTTRRLMLRTVRRPGQVAVGGGSIAVSVGRTIWAGRGNRALTPQRRAGGRIRALAVNGTRVAWLEQRGRLQRVRLGRVR